MRLDMCLFADAASATPDGKLYVHGGGITRLMPPEIPWRQPSLALVLRFAIEPEDADRRFELSLHVTAPDGTELPPSSLYGETGRSRAIAGEESYAQAIIELANLPIDAEGPFRFEIRLDGETIRSLALMVVGPAARGRPDVGTRRVPN